MKHKLSILAVFVMALALPMTANAQFSYTYQGQTLYFSIVSNAAMVVNHYSYDELSGDLVIPDSVTYGSDTYPVTTIGNDVFRDCSGLTSVTIGNSVTLIGNQAFLDCSGLTSVTLGNSVISIGDMAFEGCRALTSLIIPNSVIRIGEWAFASCVGLTSVTIGNSVSTIGERAFYFCYRIGTVTIPNSVTTIGKAAFLDCSGLTSVTIGNSVTTIGEAAFGRCSGLTRTNYTGTVAQWCGINFATDSSNPISFSHNFYVNNVEIAEDLIIPNSTTLIGDYAFLGCSGLTSVTIGNSVTSIGCNAFTGCSSLATINYNATNCTSIGRLDGSTYYYAWPTGAVTTLNIGENVISIPDLAFYNCSGLTSVTIPNSVTSIGRNAFYGCSSLDTINYNATSCTSIGYYVWPTGAVTTLNIGENVLSIPDNAFNDCSGLTSATIPNSVTSIGDYAFYNCSGLTSVSLPNSVTTIGQLAFRGCSGLTSITLPNSLDSISYGTFSRCSGLTSISIPSSVTSIGNSAFYNCSGLTTISIPEGVTSIGGWAFSGCSGLTDVTIASSVTSIGDSAFAGGDHIIQMTCNAAVPPTVTNVNAFDDVFRGIPLYVPTASLSSYQVAYGWREFTNFIGISTYTITATSNNPAWGTVSGGGSYADGATATLTAMPNAGYRFVRWQDGNTENPRTVTVTSDATYIAYFEATQGIDDTESMDVHVFVDNNRIVVAGAAQLPITVFDMTGRKVAGVATGTQEPCSFSTQTAGVYMVRVGDLPARKIVVLK